MINIYIAVAPLQIYQIPLLINKHFINDENYVFIFYKEKKGKIDLSLYKGCKVFYYDTSSLFNFFLSMIKFKSELNQIIKNKRYNLFIPHVYHSATNYTAFFTNPEKYFLLADGLLNYYKREVSTFDKYRMLLKKIYSIFVGMRYRIYSGLLTGEDIILYKRFFSLQSVKQDNNQLRSCENNCLIMDQDLLGILNKDEVLKVVNIMKNYVCLKKYNKIYYKKHPSQSKKSILLKALEECKLHVVVINNSLPIEIIYNEYPVKEIISFISSSLINIRDMNSNIKLTSIGAKTIFEKRQNTKHLLDLFVQKDILIVEEVK